MSAPFAMRYHDGPPAMKPNRFGRHDHPSGGRHATGGRGVATDLSTTLALGQDLTIFSQLSSILHWVRAACWGVNARGRLTPTRRSGSSADPPRTPPTFGVDVAWFIAGRGVGGSPDGHHTIFQNIVILLTYRDMKI